MNVNSNNGTLAQAMTGQRMQEIQAMVFMAKMYPRDEFAAIAKIKESCKRKDLAEAAIYSYPRGGQNITGPSIRLAEAIARSWGNIKQGTIELEQKNGESTAMSYAWDIETNTYDEKVFTVRHEVEKRGGNKKLESDRDIYEKVANFGARRKRACILSIIPSWVLDEALETVRETLKNNKEPLVDRVRKMIELLKEKHGISKEMVEQYIGKTIDCFTEDDGINLKGIYQSIKDGQYKPSDYFEFPKPAEKKVEKPNLDAQFGGDTNGQITING